MPIQVERVQPRGSFLSNILGMFNTAHNTYSAFKGGSGGAEGKGPEFSSGSLGSGKNALGGADMSSQIGQQSGDFSDQMNAITRRAYSLGDGAKAAAMDGELGSGAAAAEGASAGYGASAAGAGAAGYAGADAASSGIAALA